jgi:serine/threonine protein phosphatase PrpC
MQVKAPSDVAIEGFQSSTLGRTVMSLTERQKDSPRLSANPGKDGMNKSSERHIQDIPSMSHGGSRVGHQGFQPQSSRRNNLSPNSFKNIEIQQGFKIGEIKPSNAKTMGIKLQNQPMSSKPVPIESRVAVAMKFTGVELGNNHKIFKPFKDLHPVKNERQERPSEKSGLNLPLNKRGSESKETSLRRTSHRDSGINPIQRFESIGTNPLEKKGLLLRESLMSKAQRGEPIELIPKSPSNLLRSPVKSQNKAEVNKSLSPPVIRSIGKISELAISKNPSKEKIQKSSMNDTKPKITLYANEAKTIRASPSKNKIPNSIKQMPSPPPERIIPQTSTDNPPKANPKELAQLLQYNLRAKSPQFDALNAQKFLSTKNLLETGKVPESHVLDSIRNIRDSPHRSSLPFLVTEEETDMFKVFKIEADGESKSLPPNEVIDIKNQGLSVIDPPSLPNSSNFMSHKNSGDDNSFSKDELSDIKPKFASVNQKFYSNILDEARKNQQDIGKLTSRQQDDTVKMPLVPSKYQSHHPKLYSRKVISRNTSQEPTQKDNDFSCEKTEPNTVKETTVEKKKIELYHPNNVSHSLTHSPQQDEPGVKQKQRGKTQPEVFLSFSEIKKSELGASGDPLSPDLSSVSGSIRPEPQQDLIKNIELSGTRLPPFERPKVVIRRHEPFEAFAINTHKGIIRNYNEDRVSVLLNGQKKFKNRAKGISNQQKINSCAMFSVFDGHGGISCCNFLKERLHDTLVEELDIDGLFIPSIKKIFRKLDQEHLATSQSTNSHSFSGSCSITIIFINNTGFAINVGDSRSIMSKRRGKEVAEITSDHKPDKIAEFNRIVENGGELYKMSSNLRTFENQYHFVKNFQELKTINELEKHSKDLVFGPWRINPGGLSVSRTFGDKESKETQYGGAEGIVIPDPDVFDFDLDGGDFVLLGSDGVFDRLTNTQIVQTVWETITYHKGKSEDVNQEFVLGECVNNVLKRAMLSRSEDNVTVIMVCLANLFE